jgi:hypothetical protein
MQFSTHANFFNNTYVFLVAEFEKVKKNVALTYFESYTKKTEKNLIFQKIVISKIKYSKMYFFKILCVFYNKNNGEIKF